MAAVNDSDILRIRRLPGLTDYAASLAAMRRFTERRSDDTPDELWLLEHPPVYTLGLNGNPAHVLAAAGIPVVQTDRGGQVTYHGPGQLVVYPLLDLARRRLGVRDLVIALESAVISVAAAHGIEAAARREAPGVYVGGAKLASVGLRVRRGACYHGLAVNVDVDLAPFAQINPCGFAGLKVTQFRELNGPASVNALATELTPALLNTLGIPQWAHGPAVLPE